MAQALMVKDQEQVEEWGLAQGGGWVETVLGQVPAGIAFALAVGQGFRIKQAFLVMT